ncbi:MAG TPA: hypothetical protein VIJ15_09670 [Dermatophilaceae bacterium]
MDPVTVILGAISAAGAAVGSQAIKDAYAGFKELILRKFGGQDGRLQERLEDFETDASTFEKPTEKALRDVGADRDQQVVDAATNLLKQAEAERPGISGGLVGELNAQGGKVIVANIIHGPITM